MAATPPRDRREARLLERLRKSEKELAEARELLARVGHTAMSRAEFLMFGLASDAALLAEHPLIVADTTLTDSLIAMNGRIGAAMEALGNIAYEVSTSLPKKPPRKRTAH
jgi:hypothetical protein